MSWNRSLDLCSNKVSSLKSLNVKNLTNDDQTSSLPPLPLNKGWNDDGIPTTNINKFFVVIFENQNYDEVKKHNMFSNFAKNGANLVNYHGLVHPSQLNYVGLISGLPVTDPTYLDTFGKLIFPHNMEEKTFNEACIADLLEVKNRTWKTYVENYPGNCNNDRDYDGGLYRRKHNPFIMFDKVRNSWCDKVVNADQLIEDIKTGNIPDFSFYVPNMRNDGHDTGLEFSNYWFQTEYNRTFKHLLADPHMTMIALFDESEEKPALERVVTTNLNSENRTYCALQGSSVIPRSESLEKYNHYSTLNTIEHRMGLGSLNKEDYKAVRIDDVFINCKEFSPDHFGGFAGRTGEIFAYSNSTYFRNVPTGIKATMYRGKNFYYISDVPISFDKYEQYDNRLYSRDRLAFAFNGPVPEEAVEQERISQGLKRTTTAPKLFNSSNGLRYIPFDDAFEFISDQNRTNCSDFESKYLISYSLLLKLYYLFTNAQMTEPNFQSFMTRKAAFLYQGIGSLVNETNYNMSGDQEFKVIGYLQN